MRSLCPTCTYTDTRKEFVPYYSNGCCSLERTLPYGSAGKSRTASNSPNIIRRHRIGPQLIWSPCNCGKGHPRACRQYICHRSSLIPATSQPRLHLPKVSTYDVSHIIELIAAGITPEMILRHPTEIKRCTFLLYPFYPRYLVVTVGYTPKFPLILPVFQDRKMIVYSLNTQAFRSNKMRKEENN